MSMKCVYLCRLIHRFLDLSFPPTTHPPLLHDLSSCHKPTTHNHRAPRKRLSAIILPPTGTDESARDRRSGKRGETDNRKNHTHPRAGLAQVRGQAAEPRGEEGLDPARGDAEEDGPRIQAGRVGHGDPGQLADARDERRRHEDVDGAPAVGEVVGDQAAEDADAVQQEQEVERVNVGEAGDVAGV